MRVFVTLFPLVTLAVHVSAQATPSGNPSTSDPEQGIELHAINHSLLVHDDSGTRPSLENSVGPADPHRPPAAVNHTPLHSANNQPAPNASGNRQVLAPPRPPLTLGQRRKLACIKITTTVCLIAAVGCGFKYYGMPNYYIDSRSIPSSSPAMGVRALPEGKEGEECDCSQAVEPANSESKQSTCEHAKRDAPRMSYRRRIANWDDDE
ncbi:hypothetical protein F5877DRAFT_78811 [Lentinula edodes]|nr:hypothetical protein F5877DRAFT_78811 [Lentinula edodes]